MTDIISNLKYYLPFINDSTVDASGNGSAGVAQGSPTTIGDFDGTNDAIAIPQQTYLDNISSQITVAMFITPDTWTAASLTTIASKQANNPPHYPSWTFCGDITTAKLLAQLIVAGTQYNLVSTNVISTGVKTHVAFTFDGTTFRLYVNGILNSSVVPSPAGSITTQVNAIWVGASEQFGRYYDGKIEEFRVYDRALSAADLLELLKVPSPAVIQRSRHASFFDILIDDPYIVKTFTAPSTTNFTHFFVKRVGDTVYVYINNTLIGSGVVGTKHLEMDSDNKIGASHFNSNVFNGEIKKLHFYNYALDDTDRQAIYTGGL